MHAPQRRTLIRRESSDTPWAGELYPTADPAATAEQLNGRVLAVYAALGLPQTVVRDPQDSGGTEADVYGCHRRGLAHAVDGLDSSAPPEPRTAAIRSRLAVKGLTDPQGEAALDRAGRTLAGLGWTVTSSREFGAPVLALKPPAPSSGVLGGVSVSYTSGYLRISAGAECARYPGGTAVDWEGKPQGLPGLVVPVELRRS
ncbi:hypothetical protein GCM10018790_58460 [Kitasatospora xanthocidica]|uniref:hypothetical protein n=1 Tax=Kitasatospora xanthocidica TaxID=83382 RepID=UPI00167ABA94|nr:hypothetical protein [Kitasatospora xanthocidica]GHF72874.1 hypothetical protein GCM10018790_58460 [Kitasatospora xanthocidica]